MLCGKELCGDGRRRGGGVWASLVINSYVMERLNEQGGAKDNIERLTSQLSDCEIIVENVDQFLPSFIGFDIMKRPLSNHKKTGGRGGRLETVFVSCTNAAFLYDYKQVLRKV